MRHYLTFHNLYTISSPNKCFTGKNVYLYRQPYFRYGAQQKNINRMKRTVSLLTILMTLSVSILYAQQTEQQLAKDNYRRYYGESIATSSPEKGKAIEELRAYFAQNGYRSRESQPQIYLQYMALLQADGTFSDLKDADAGKASEGNQADSGGSITDAYTRLWVISEAFKSGKLTYADDGEIWKYCQKAIIHYGNLEISRPNTNSRFHSSCFAIPTAAVNSYFCHLSQMDASESGKDRDELLKEACDMLKTIALQAWTQPLRHDETDANVVSIPRFRNHVWWVGGNALGYRSLLPVAAMYHSIPMVDLLAEICQRCISVTSQNTYSDAFWTEGFTADGAGWGHGMQCLVWGYPIDGAINALNMLGLLKNTPWEQKLTRENADALLNYFRGSNYYYYKGFISPCVDRYSMTYKPNKNAIRYQGMLEVLLKDWQKSFTEKELTELEQLYTETQKNVIQMSGYPVYNGTRWFFNNDDLMKKNADYHIIVNMASVRCDGLESADTFADAYNYYTTDGATMFLKTGNEYRKAFGAYDVTAFPGVTAREGMDRLRPVTNWRGYCSKYNFAAAATSGGKNAAAGYIFEKMNAADKEKVNDKGTSISKDSVLYDVKAYKSYFMLGDYMVALGAGITNMTPDFPGNIRTTLEQTEHTDSIFLYRGKGIDWVVQQGKFAYSAFPEYTDRVHYVCETKQTDWMKMNPSNKNGENLPEKVDVFRMWIDHGQRPVNDTYGYAVYAGEGIPASQYPFRTLRNDTLVQAVQSVDKMVTGAVFYDPQTSLKVKGLSLSVSAPCAVLIEQRGKETTLSITDALMNKDCKIIEVVWNGKTISCDMPQGELCGKPAIMTIK